ncbi:MAG: tyrosine-type recombinase/integrase [Mycobacteriales bacterium]
MASVSKRLRDGQTTWLARWRDPAGRQHKRSFDKRSDAERFLTSIEHAKLSGGYVDPALGRMTIGAYADLWIARQVQLRPSTRDRYATIIRTHIRPAFGQLPLTHLERSAVAAWVADLSAAGLAPPTVRHVHRVLHMIVQGAVRDSRIARNVCAGVPLPRGGERHKRFLDHGQVNALADAAGGARLPILVLAYCGIRFGELAALRVRSVDTLRRRLTIAESATEVAGRMVFGPPKSGRRRSVPIPRSLIEPLAVQCAGKDKDALVFTAPEGGVIYLRNWRRRVFDPAVRAAGLESLTPHELRHTAASLAVAAGASVKSVQRMLGHASAAMTLDVYAGLFDDDLDSVADRLDRAAADALVTPARPEGNVSPLHARVSGL